MNKTVEEYKDDIYEQWFNTTPKQKKEGKSWYGRANRICNKIAKQYDIPLYKVVGILAALSPSNKWERNILDTKNFIKERGNVKVCTYRVNKAKALDILLNANGKQAVLKILNGPKTTAFFTNIFHPRTGGAVTIDRWALRSVQEGESLPIGQKRKLVEAYQEAAHDACIKPHELQAIVWIAVKEKADADKASTYNVRARGN